MMNHIKKLKIGNPLDEENLDVVPLIDNSSADFVWGLIEDAKEKGATLFYGGKRNAKYLFNRHYFDFVTLDINCWEEPFGPVLPIIRVKSLEEAIEVANASEYGLQSSVFTVNLNKAFEVAKKLEVGTVQVNNRTERGPDHLPFLGIKNSGVGVQGIAYSIESMTHIKSTVINL